MTAPLSSPAIIASLCGLLAGVPALPAHAAGPDDVKQRADQSFNRLSPQLLPNGNGTAAPGLPASDSERASGYAADKYWIGTGQGDLTKGPIICQRVSELSARTDLAKQIRVMVKEHMVDRVRDRSGREPEQDIELTREELVQEYLQDVKIVDRRIDEDKKICSATAVMPKITLQPKPVTDSGNALPTPLAPRP
ncbi:MAG: hypothetical protein RI101_10750 [Nitrospira sp.]|jgi:hypothetical protein|nr:hypothetical protein [Nitrospira sp.]